MSRTDLFTGTTCKLPASWLSMCSLFFGAVECACDVMLCEVCRRVHGGLPAVTWQCMLIHVHMLVSVCMHGMFVWPSMVLLFRHNQSRGVLPGSGAARGREGEDDDAEER